MSEEVEKIGVVGAGLSGLYTAKWLLSEEKYRDKYEVEVYEAQEQENYSVDCGNGVINIRNYLQYIWCDLEPYIRNEIKEVLWRFSFGEEKKELSFYFDDYFYLVDRLSWQKKLIKEVQELGADIYFGVNKEPREINKNYDICVDARGSLKGANAIYCISKLNTTELSDDVAFLEFKPTLNGYYWFFPYNDELINIGYGSFGNNVSKEDLLNYLSNFNVGEILKFGGGKIDTGFGEKLAKGEDPIVKEENNIYRVGDRVGLADSLIAEGVGGAVLSAYILSTLIKRNKMNEYSDWLKRQNNFLKYTYNLRNKFKENYEGFVNKFLSLDKIEGKYLANPPKLLLRHPIKAIKFFIK